MNGKDFWRRSTSVSNSVLLISLSIAVHSICSDM